MNEAKIIGSFLFKANQKLAKAIEKRVRKDDFSIDGKVTVKAHIKTLRKKMHEAGKVCIYNVWGIGYKFVPPDEQ
ncbi:MAG: winged helix-turn-helix domain-containing protein [Lachnospiraceae bacterium]|nr:winged helix-turn-helix domain-containing protein [Lachnospiraceae bacterium]